VACVHARAPSVKPHRPDKDVGAGRGATMGRGDETGALLVLLALAAALYLAVWLAEGSGGGGKSPESPHGEGSMTVRP
jgi:hypothetical protein